MASGFDLTAERRKQRWVGDRGAWRELPIPIGLNTDNPMPDPKSRTSPYFHNICPGNVESIYVRAGARLAGGSPDLSGYGGQYVFFMGQVGKKIMGCLTDGVGTGNLNWWPQYYTGPAGGRWDMSTGASQQTVKTIYTFSADVSSAGVAVTNTTLHPTTYVVAPFGKPEVFDNTLVGATAKPASREHKDGTSSSATKIMVWGGSTGTTTVSTTVTINNAATSGTFGAVVNVDLTGWFITVTASPLAGYRYTYKIKSNTVGGTAFVLEKPYGLGENTTNVPNAAAAAAEIQPAAYLRNSPPDAVCVGQFRGRLFAGRGQVLTYTNGLKGYYGTMISWTQPGEFNKWDAQNFAVLDGDDSDDLMGMAQFADRLILFRRRSIWQVTGFDESSFEFTKLHGSVGLIDSNSIVQDDEGIYFADYSGFYLMRPDGALRNLCRYDSRNGIMRLWRYIFQGDTEQAQRLRLPHMVHAVSDAHRVYVCQYAPSVNTSYYNNQMPFMLVYDKLSGMWATWGWDTDVTSQHATCFPKGGSSGQYPARIMANISCVMRTDGIFFPGSDYWTNSWTQSPAARPDADQVYDAGNQIYIAAPGPINIPFDAYWGAPDVISDGPDTFRVDKVWLEHGCQLAGGTTPGNPYYINTGQALDTQGAGPDSTMTLPYGIKTGDILIMSATAENASAAFTASGWTQINSTSANGMTLTTFWTRYNSDSPASTTLNWTGSGFSVVATITAYRGCVSSGSPIGANNVTTQASGTTLTAAALTSTGVNQQLVMVAALDCVKNAPAQWSTWGAATAPNSANCTERFDWRSGWATGVGVGQAEGTKATVGSTGSISVTLASNVASIMHNFFLLPDQTVPPSMWDIKVSEHNTRFKLWRPGDMTGNTGSSIWSPAIPTSAANNQELSLGSVYADSDIGTNEQWRMQYAFYDNLPTQNDNHHFRLRFVRPSVPNGVTMNATNFPEADWRVFRVYVRLAGQPVTYDQP